MLSPPEPPTEAAFFMPEERRNVMDPVVLDLSNRLNCDLQELFQERAAMREYAAGMSRDLAEALGLLDVVHMRTRDAFRCWL